MIYVHPLPWNARQCPSFNVSWTWLLAPSLLSKNKIGMGKLETLWWGFLADNVSSQWSRVPPQGISHVQSVNPERRCEDCIISVVPFPDSHNLHLIVRKQQTIPNRVTHYTTPNQHSSVVKIMKNKFEKLSQNRGDLKDSVPE